MAKCVIDVQGNFHSFCDFIKKELLSSSFSASLEDEQYVTVNDVNIAIIVMERYSYTGDNRLSMTINIIGYNNYLRITAITSGGSQGMFFKINTFGEDAFLDKFKKAIQKYKG